MNNFQTPNSIVGQLNRSINAGAPVLDQVSSSSPNFDSMLQPPANTPMPNKSPVTPLERALHRRGMTNVQVPQQASQQATQGQGGPEITLPVNDSNPNQPGVQVPASEAEKLIGALEKISGTFGKRLEMINKHEERVRDHVFPKVGPESQAALEQMGNTMDSGNMPSPEDMQVLDQHVNNQLNIPPKILARMSPQQRLAELLGAIQQPR